jgi:2',3'-cyclic-nucleotide 2'-phosphodiesterase (5'-nucleotidase family)
MKRIQSKLTYANVMSSIAVFLILGGASAWAAKKIGTNQLKANAVTTGKIKNEAVDVSKVKNGAVTNPKIADGSVTTAKIAEGQITTERIANDAVTGDKVKESSLSEVPSANSANPSAFAKVNSNGTVDSVNSKGISGANVSHPSTGVYCVTAPSFPPKGGQATTQAGTPGTTAQITIGGTASCPLPAVEVKTWTTGPAATADLTFYVELYR